MHTREATLSAMLLVAASIAFVPFSFASGPFLVAPTFQAGPRAFAITIADFNNDGFPDLATANDNGDVSVLLGDGNGSFEPSRDFAAGTGPTSLAAGDFNQDGYLDLVVGDTDSGAGKPKVALLLGNGDGTFQPPRFFSGKDGSYVVGVGDFNNDGLPDVIASGGSTTELFLGNGDGTLQTEVSVSSSSAGTIGDFNRDGNLDVAVCYSNSTVGILLGDGTGKFMAAAPISVPGCPLASADFNGDGKLDIVTADGYPQVISVLLGNGDGTLQPPLTTPNATEYVLTAGDFNGDGIPDLAGLKSTGDIYPLNQLTVYWGAGDGTFPRQTGYSAAHNPIALVAGDLNGDGVADLATASNEQNATVPSQISVLLGNHGGSLRAARLYPGSGNYPSAVVADFNHDGNLDVVTTSGVNGYVSVLLGDGHGKLADQFNSQIKAVGVIAGDLNGDGNLDLIVVLQAHLDYAVLLGNGDGSFQLPQRFKVGPYYGPLALGDFNGDGKLDLAAGPSQANAVYIALGNGDGTFQQAVSYPVGGTVYALAVADLTGDGILDVAAGLGDQMVILSGDGSGGFQLAQTLNLPGDEVIAADVNNDGIPDLLSSGPGITLALGQGNGLFASPTVVSGSYYLEAVADFTQDGNQDLLAASYFDPETFLLLKGLGNGHFGPAIDIPICCLGPAVAGDFNKDAKLDAAVASPSGVVVLLNSGP